VHVWVEIAIVVLPCALRFMALCLPSHPVASQSCVSTLWSINGLSVLQFPGGFPYPSTTNEEVLEYLLQGKRLYQPPGCANEV
jgi:hypothetical protein